MSEQPKKTLRRGAHRRADCTVISFPLPRPMLELMDRVVAEEDTDRSKFIRGAVRKEIERRKLQHA